jgi:hypothetical protein
MPSLPLRRASFATPNTMSRHGAYSTNNIISVGWCAREGGASERVVREWVRCARCVSAKNIVNTVLNE